MTNKPLKVLFAGTADFSATFLQPILDSHHQVVAVVTQIDKVAGRGKKLQMTKVKQLALEHDVPVYQFETSLRNPENYTKLFDLDFDILVVVAFGDILPIELLDHAKYKSINVHPSLLPFGRGASPVQNTIAKGDSNTAFCIIKMDATLDTGDILVWKDVNVDRFETSQTLFNKLSVLGGPVLIDVLDNIEHYLANAQAQKPLNIENPKKAYTRKIKKEHGLFKPSLKAITLERKLRAYTPWPGLYYQHPEDAKQDIKIIDALAYDSLEDLLINNKVAGLTLMPELSSILNQEQLQDSKVLDFMSNHQGTIIASSKKSIYIACGQATVLEIKSIQLPGKKPTDIASIKNGYPQLVQVGNKLMHPEQV